MLKIQTTGLEEYAPGGKARVKVMVIGGPGVGKTRWASYFPRPLYADCEGGLASVADRSMPYVSVNSSQDMLDVLAYAKSECQKPVTARAFDTLVIDTFDAFQRKVKNEWMEKERKQVFTGWEAWGYLNSKMQMLMTRLLNLDLNVVVLVHYKDRTTKDDETGKETHTFTLQVQGEVADTAYNDFDLIGWMGTYWEAVDGERTQKRGLTFKPTPERPMLKDRLHVLPDWLEVTFEPTDYTGMFDRIQARVEDLVEGSVIGEIPSVNADGNPSSNFVVPVGAIGSGALPETSAKDIPLAQLDRPTLLRRCRDAGIATTVDGTPIKSNTIKSELIAALEAHDSGTSTTPTPTPTPADAAPVAATTPARPAPTQPVANPRRARSIRNEPEGRVDTATGELLDHPATETAVGTETAVQVVEDVLGGTVLAGEDPTPVEAPAPAPASVPVPISTCEECGKDLQGENPDFVKLSWIKFRKKLCQSDYLAAKNAK